MAEVFTAFIGAATQHLDIAVYGFRLVNGSLTDQVVGAVKAVAGRGVSIRLAYDRVQGAADDVTLKAFPGAGGDPAPVGIHTFLQAARFPASVQVRAVEEEAIDPGHEIMHQKYMVGIQDNNMLVITGAANLTAAYEQDFADLWSAQKLAGTDVGDAGTTVNGTQIGYSFAPGEGVPTEDDIAGLMAAATIRIKVASMVISSGKILQALANQLNVGLGRGGHL